MSIEENWVDECCAMAPALSSADLIAVADGEATELTLAHLHGCPDCAARVAQIRTFQAQLRQQLYRLHCPSSDLLIDYCQGLLDPYQYTALVHHLALCPHCMAEVALLERGATPPEAPVKLPRWLGAPAR